MSVSGEPMAQLRELGRQDGLREAKAAKSVVIELLEQKIAELETQNAALQAHNTELLLRARKAEEEARRWASNSRPG